MPKAYYLKKIFQILKVFIGKILFENEKDRAEPKLCKINNFSNKETITIEFISSMAVSIS